MENIVLKDTYYLHPLDMTLVCRRALTPILTLLLTVKQGGIGYHFDSLWYDSAGARTCKLPISGRTLNYKATELVVSAFPKYIS